jgi:ribonuclease HI
VYELQFDGLFRRVGHNTKTGLMAYGWLIYKHGRVIARGYGAVAGRAEATSNIAEYLALLEGLTALCDMGLCTESILVAGDSKIVISQMTGKAAVHAERMKELHLKACGLAENFFRIQYEWRKRSKNKPADLLTRHALKQARKNQMHYAAVVEKLMASRGYCRSQNLVDSFLPLVDLSVFQPTGIH